jgi:uncharacterized protein with GYD domain
MPKYLVRASYTAEGMKGLISEGGTGRVEAVKRVTEPLGGTVESLYFAFGSDDIIVVLDFPDNVTMAAVAMTVAASGQLTTQAIPLLTPEEVDEAARKSIDFRPPGQ